jgi:alpha-tubulin suppressor-like RCC1 family protein
MRSIDASCLPRLLLTSVVIVGACFAGVRPATAACGETPKVATDKGDYGPTETAIVSGSGYACGETLFVLITAPDGTTLNGDGTGSAGPDTVVTDGEGAFTLSYRLAGTFPDGSAYHGQLGLYRVEVLDPAGNVRATATFTDGQGYFSCAVTTSGGARCWGSNWTGQLGDGTSDRRLTAADVTGLGAAVVQISTGYDHACALLSGGGVTCWGGNEVGQLGDGTATTRFTPTDVIGLTSGVAQISAGLYATCAVTGSGAVKCWGQNFFGQLGDGTQINRLTPVDVVGLGGGAAQVSVGGTHVCAVTTTGGAKCWGYGGNGQLGGGASVSRATPVDVVGLTAGVEQISAGHSHTCALLAGGGVKCWGANYSGQLGNGLFSFQAAPVAVTNLGAGAAQVRLGWNHSCAVMVNGGVKCWGDNWDGFLGDGTAVSSAVPVDVVGLGAEMTQVAAGAYHTCALSQAGGVKCWGHNAYGQLGDGTVTRQARPVDGFGLTGGIAALWDGTHSPASDSTPPSASPVQSPLANAAGWNNTDVTVTWNWIDDVGGSGLDNGYCPSSSTSSGEGNPLTLSATCRDVAGLEGIGTYAVKVDKTPPTVSAEPDTSPNPAGWYNTDVQVTFTCADTLSGIATCPEAQTLSGEGRAISSSAQIATDLAGNASQESGIITANIDRTAPHVSLIGGPATGASYYFGAVAAPPTCSVSDPLSGVDGGCTVSGYSTSVGSHTVTATARDYAGNQNTTSVTYAVLSWTLSGFYQPIDMGDVWNTVRNGARIPIKFEVFAGSTELTDLTTIVQPLTANQKLCSGGPSDEIELLDTGATALRYDIESGQFIYHWQTPKKPGYCYTVTITLRDGSSRSAKIQLR